MAEESPSFIMFNADSSVTCKATSRLSNNFSKFNSTIFNYTSQAQAPHAWEWGKHSHSLCMQCSQEVSQEYIQETDNIME
jgi:hypothetical protein